MHYLRNVMHYLNYNEEYDFFLSLVLLSIYNLFYLDLNLYYFNVMSPVEA